MTGQWPKTIIKEQTVAYWGLGSDELTPATGGPGPVRVLAVTGVGVGVGIALWSVGHRSIGTPIISGALVVGIGYWYRRWEARKRS
jgi:hypothetical protein